MSFFAIGIFSDRTGDDFRLAQNCSPNCDLICLTGNHGLLVWCVKPCRTIVTVRNIHCNPFFGDFEIQKSTMTSSAQHDVPIWHFRQIFHPATSTNTLESQTPRTRVALDMRNTWRTVWASQNQVVWMLSRPTNRLDLSWFVIRIVGESIYMRLCGHFHDSSLSYHFQMIGRNMKKPYAEIDFDQSSPHASQQHVCGEIPGLVTQLESQKRTLIGIDRSAVWNDLDTWAISTKISVSENKVSLLTWWGWVACDTYHVRINPWDAMAYRWCLGMAFQLCGKFIIWSASETTGASVVLATLFLDTNPRIIIQSHLRHWSSIVNNTLISDHFGEYLYPATKESVEMDP